MKAAQTRVIRLRGRDISRSRAILAGLAAAFLVAAAVIVPLALRPGGAPHPARAAGAGRAAAGRPALAMTSFAGYSQAPLPGAPGLEVNAVASADGQRLAAGSSGGYPAIWRQDPGGDWSLVTSAADPPAAAGPATLTSLAHGPAGWLAVGPGPVVLSSQDGTAWRPAAGITARELGKISSASAAGGPHGYIILGRLAVPGGCVADVWWSPDLRTWARAHDVNATAGSSQTLAVAARPGGFVSVGSHGGKPAAWITSDGTTWRTIVLPGPANAQLNQIAVAGNRVIATGGSDGQGTRARAFAVSSSDGGATWQQGTLQLPNPATVITALAAAGRGWVAAGQYGSPGQQRVVLWQLPAGSGTWAQAKVAGITAGPDPARTSEITALGGFADSVTGIGAADPGQGRQAAVFTMPAL